MCGGEGYSLLVDHARLVVESWRSKSRDFKVGWEIVLAGNYSIFFKLLKGKNLTCDLVWKFGGRACTSTYE